MDAGCLSRDLAIDFQETKNLAASAGIEPTLTESKSVVLPLDELAMEIEVGFEPTFIGFAVQALTIQVLDHSQ